MQMTIPANELEEIAKRHGFDQVIIIARKIGTQGKEAVGHYGINAEHKAMASEICDYLKYKVMGWKK